ncbi:DNA-binding transcriptional regulator, FadR family [Quadrisphaera granulorum]|uniref:DNA-binding FadR family transcriptional regulator n=1 Tax=Quadrisphaera granulorum TaxID=317664 RepID=A0A316AFC6_9ACTN|nr:FCD domain-containing protein [Quadrisphaera granulorum]PWJ56485.1 DNA-binding FadR family transcriptional regulator [Quadrisphaera granulorum]SZE95119.1 DNA-binding transcriptional regulator, FadR family [Quadrisphaera granulorum]
MAVTTMSAETLHEGVLDVLGAEIAGGTPPPGSVLRLEDLAARFDVSRTVAREVVRILESMSMVSSRRRVGVTIRPLAEWNVLDPRVIRWRLAGTGRRAQLTSLTVLRAGVEPVAASEAAHRASADQIDRLLALARDLLETSRLGDLASFLEADIAFHQTVLEASGNELLAALHPAIAEVLVGRTQHQLMPNPPRDVAVDLHRQVAEAIARRDARAAGDAMRSIVSEVGGALTE